ncbi:MAG: Hpt domain-containing protein [Paracoccaceae bacterium]
MGHAWAAGAPTGADTGVDIGTGTATGTTTGLPGGAATALDRGVLDDLAAEGDLDFLDELIEGLAGEMTAYRRALDEAAEAGETGRVADILHGMRGAAAALGLTAFAAATLALEDAARGGEAPGPAVREALGRAFVEGERALAAWRQEISG